MRDRESTAFAPSTPGKRHARSNEGLRDSARYVARTTVREATDEQERSTMENPVDASPVAERLRALLRSSPGLTDEAVALARALGPDESGRIIAEVIDAPFALEAVGSQVRAGHLARELGLVAAVEPLLRFIGRTGVQVPVGKTVLSILARFGAAGAGALLSLLERSSARDRPRITEALARVEVEDERIRTHLARMLGEAPRFAAALLVQRGEWRAMPNLVAALDRLALRPVADGDICAADDLSAIGRAVIAVGGRLSSEHEAKIDEAFARAEPTWTSLEDDPIDEPLPTRTPAVRDPRAGRNEPCPCGSGKKHKRCCLDRDRGDPRH
jgi:hypothetical protein